MKTYKEYLPEITLKLTKSEYQKIQISTSKDSEVYIRNFYHDDLELYESFFILLLNRSNKTIGYAKISQGGINGTVIDYTIIAKYVINSLAQNVILCHNHPSGNKQPSKQDIDVTKKIVDTLNIFDCKVLDHIILTSDSYFSCADEGLI